MGLIGKHTVLVNPNNTPCPLLYLRSRYIAVANVPLMLPNIAIQRRAYIIEPIHDNLSQSAISLHQLFTSCPHMTCERASFGLGIREYSLPFSLFGFKNILILILNWLSCCHDSTCDIIPKLSINMGTYPHLVSSQIPHILLSTSIQY